MDAIKFNFVLLFILFFTTNIVSSACENGQTKTTLPKYDNLTLIGQTIVESSLNRTLHRFLGIPYAKPPVGKLRFRRPLPWSFGTNQNSTLEALSWPNACFQTFAKPSGNEKYLQEHFENISEDCLYLNVWTPNVQEQEKLRPVLVYFYPGGFYYGDSSFELINGETLASRADAVVVTINYRVSTFGFLYSDMIPEISGNQGLWDQALALKWIRENIQHFGGNSNEITISGTSAGSWSVSAHILSPISRNLFKNAIMMSGAVVKIHDPTEYAQKVLKGIRAVGCASQNDSSIDEKVVQCLENLDATKVYSVLWLSFGNLFPPILVKDKEFFPDFPEKMIAEKNHKTNFSLLFSTVEDEAPFIFYPQETDKRFARTNPEPITIQGAQEYLSALLKNALGNKNAPETTINKIYFSGLNSKTEDNQNALRRAISVAYGDYILSCPTIDFVKSLFKSSPESIQAYQWYYTAKLGNPTKLLCSAWSGTCHTDDIFSFFGVPFRFPDQFLNHERDISNEVINFVKSFIRTGNLGNSEWKSYFMSNSNSGTKEVIAPYYELGNQAQSSASFKFNLKQLQCENIWNQFIY